MVRGKTRVMIPFASGNLTEVELNMSEANNDSRPVNAFPIGDPGPGLIQSANLAAEVAGSLAQKHASVKNQHVIVYWLKALSPTTSLVGQSGGLGLALAFYSKLSNTDLGTICATGCITSLEEGGKIDRIDGINEKLAGLLNHGENNIAFLYPSANDCEISEEVKRKCSEKKIELRPVQSIEEAVDSILQPPGTNQQTGLMRANPVKLFSAVIVISALVIVTLFFSLHLFKPQAETVIAAPTTPEPGSKETPGVSEQTPVSRQKSYESAIDPSQGFE